ncbi:hypothetical protein IJI31_00865 [bacterium]|nr:hypothetical protein [bacterium]
MDLIMSDTMNITKFALDGLNDRQKAIASNVANVMTPGYLRKEVSFESQLAEINEKAELKQYIKEKCSVEYKPTTLEEIMGDYPKYITPNKLEKAYLQSNIYQDYNPQLMDDIFTGGSRDGNNVELEKEMADLAKTGTKYKVLTNLEKRNFENLQRVIQSQ